MRNVVVYAARKTFMKAFNHKGDFHYGKFVYILDCDRKKVTTKETIIYSDRFDTIDAEAYMLFHQMFEQASTKAPYADEAAGEAQVRDYRTMLRLFSLSRGLQPWATD